jgi:xanthine dehydrogenase molybdenum-binding subunit
VTRVDASAALAMPGVKGILTADELPAPADVVTDLGQTIKANMKGERALTNEPLYQGEPILAVAAVDEETAAEAIEKIQIEFEPLPFAVDPLAALRPGRANPRVDGNIWGRPAPPQGRGGAPGVPDVQEVKWNRAGFCRLRCRKAANGQADRRMDLWRRRRRLQERRARAR